MNRREFLCHSACLSLGSAFASLMTRAEAVSAEREPVFSTRNERWQRAYDKALSILAGNVRLLAHSQGEVLIEGAQYGGIWLECAAHEALVYRRFRPDVARNAHMTFFRLQRPDGQFPAWLRNGSRGFAQIQMVVPIAATAWELARLTQESELLETAYHACGRWDRWLTRHRDTRGTGLTEGFCTFDTGHDNSPRWRGIPNECPHGDARRVPRVATIPRLCPDLSATVYGGRIALAEMAKALGLSAEADEWTESAETMRKLILERLYVAEEAAFYDLDAMGRFVRVLSDVISRVCGEHVPDQSTFDAIWEKQLHNERAFWAPYPFPSIAMDDPTFVGTVPGNSWGGPSQALTALRAGRWMDYYNRPAEFATLMDRWCEAIQTDMTFRQQINPTTGVFAPHDRPGYSPTSLVMYDFTWRLAGIVEQDSELWWNMRPGHPAAEGGRFSLWTTSNHRADLRYAEDGAELEVDDKLLAKVSGGVVRLATSPDGQLLSVLGVSERTESVEIEIPGSAPRMLTLLPNQRISL